MPRQARKRSETGIYHVMLRGINRQTIFHDDEDCLKFIDVMKNIKSKCTFELYAYCLMGNHVHLLLHEKDESVSTIIKRICSSFVYWYNLKYDRFGHLFQERFRSETVEDERYLFTVFRYIHQNPIKAGLVSRPEDYRWSSYNDYFMKRSFIDTTYILNLFSENLPEAVNKFKEFMAQENDDICLDYDEKPRYSDDDILKLIEEKYGVKKGFFHLLEEEKRMNIIRSLKSFKGVSIRQISRVTGISKYKVENA